MFRFRDQGEINRLKEDAKDWKRKADQLREQLDELKEKVEDYLEVEETWTGMVYIARTLRDADLLLKVIKLEIGENRFQEIYKKYEALAALKCPNRKS